RTGKNGDVAVACRFVLIAFFTSRDVANQAGENRTVDGVVVRVVKRSAGLRLGVLPRGEVLCTGSGDWHFAGAGAWGVEIFKNIAELGMQILPLAHAEIGKKILTTEFPPLILRAEFFPFVVNGVPDVEQREEIGLRISESLVCCGSGFFLIERTFARVLNAETGGDDEEFARCLFALRLEQHAAECGINRQTREILTERCKLALR